MLVDDILQAILPEDLGDGSPSSFTITGHLGRRLAQSFSDDLAILHAIISPL